MHSRTHRWLEIASWASGIALVSFYVGNRAWSEHVSDKAVEAMQEARLARATPPPPPTIAAVSKTLAAAQPDTSTWSTKRVEEYRASLRSKDLPNAVLRIPKLGLEVPIFSGTSDAVLNRGGGHIEGTANFESVTGNVGIAAHRDGFFRPLKNIAVGDTLAVDTLDDTKTYRVSGIRIVDPSDVSVLEPTADPTITLVTCYPFYHVGSAPKRFIVTARAEVRLGAKGAMTAKD